MTITQINKFTDQNSKLIKAVNDFIRETDAMIKADIDRLEINKAINDLEHDLFHMIIAYRRLADS